MQLEFVDALGHRNVRPRQKARAHAIGDATEPQIEAGRLNLAFDKRIFRQDQAGIGHRRDHAVGQNSCRVGRQGERHRFVLRLPANPQNRILSVIRWGP
jgi:hypothetical protein